MAFCPRFRNELTAMTHGKRHKSYDTSTVAHRGFSWRDLAAWLGAVLLAVNTLAGSLASGVGAAPVQNPFGEPMEFCTSHGLVVADAGQPAAPANHQSCGECLCCLPLAHGGVVPPMVVAVAPVATEFGAAFPPADPRHVIPARRPDSAPPRAPPTA